MTVKEELHALVDRLADEDADEGLDFLRTRVKGSSRPGQAFVEESQRVLDEAAASGAPGVPHEAVHAWLQSWGTDEEAAADAALQVLEERSRREAPGTTT